MIFYNSFIYPVLASNKFLKFLTSYSSKILNYHRIKRINTNPIIKTNKIIIFVESRIFVLLVLFGDKNTC